MERKILIRVTDFNGTLPTEEICRVIADKLSGTKELGTALVEVVEEDDAG